MGNIKIGSQKWTWILAKERFKVASKEHWAIFTRLAHQPASPFIVHHPPFINDLDADEARLDTTRHSLHRSCHLYLRESRGMAC